MASQNDIDDFPCGGEYPGGMTLEEYKTVYAMNLTSIQRVAASPGGTHVFLGQQKEIEAIATAILGSIDHEPR